MLEAWCGVVVRLWIGERTGGGAARGEQEDRRDQRTQGGRASKRKRIPKRRQEAEITSEENKNRMKPEQKGQREQEKRKRKRKRMEGKR